MYELLSSKGDGAIVRSLDDKSTKFISGRVHNFSHLESIEVYTEQENVNLLEVLKAMKESSEALPSEKDAAAVKAYFEKVYPSMDFERVYASDMKKMIKWFSVLQANNIELKKTEEEQDETSDTTEAEPAEVVAEDAPEQKKPAEENETAASETAIEETAVKTTKRKKTKEQTNIQNKKL